MEMREPPELPDVEDPSEDDDKDKKAIYRWELTLTQKSLWTGALAFGLVQWPVYYLVPFGLVWIASEVTRNGVEGIRFQQNVSYWMWLVWTPCLFLSLSYGLGRLVGSLGHYFGYD
jgi:hypothetical protein